MDNQIKKTLELAEALQSNQVEANKAPFADRLKVIIEEPESKHFLIQMMDVAFRSKNYKKVAEHVIFLLETRKNYQVLFSPIERLLLKAFSVVGNILPTISVSIMLKKFKRLQAMLFFLLIVISLKTMRKNETRKILP